MGDAEVHVICGPTAAGKSAVALWLAEQHPATIVSADSRQIYRRFDIGTAKPSPGEQMAVPHRGIDIVDPTDRYSAAAWAEAADQWIGEGRRAHRVPLVVGGTGFYLRALFDPLFEEPELDAARRAALETELDTLPTGELARWTRVLDPERAHLGRTQLLRAVTMALLTGERLSDLHRALARAPRCQPRYLVVDPGPVLATRIAARVDQMFEAGWIHEVQRLVEEVPADAPAWKASGYRVVRRLVEGEITRAEAREAVIVETRQYAKRQRTWFRHQLAADRVTTLDPTARDWREQAARWLTQETATVHVAQREMRER